MPQSAAQLTAAEISRIAGVTRATVSNWRRRHPDFPAPVGGTDSSPAYDAEQVRSWLSERGQLPQRTPREELRATLRTAGDEIGGPAVRLLPLLSALAGLDDSERALIAGSPEPRQRELLDRAMTDHLSDDSGARGPLPDEFPATVLRALVECVAADGVLAALDVLTEVITEDPETGTTPTPRPLAELMVSLLAPGEERFPKSVFDPACGAGGLLLAAAEAGATEVSGQDVHDPLAALSSVRLDLATSAERLIRTGDSLRADAFPRLRAGGVVCGPPYGVRDWGHEEVAYDPRWVYGLPPKSESELAWVQHCLAHLEPGGRAVLLLPPGVAERASGRRIRSQLVRSGALRAVIGLPPGAAVPSHLGLHLWLLAAPDPEHREVAPVLFLQPPAEETAPPADSSGEQRASGRTALSWEALRERVLPAWRDFLADPEGFEAVPGVVCARPAVDVLDENVDLTPRRQVHTGAGAVDPARRHERVLWSWRELHRAGSELLDSLDVPEWRSAGSEPVAWQSATVADLLRGGALELHRISTSGAAEETAGAEVAWRVLTSADVWEHAGPSGGTGQPPSETVEIAEGDVILPDTLKGLRRVPVRVATAEDAGALLGRQLYLLRPDPERLDAWFLAGFLGSEENTHSATTGSSILRLDAKRLRVPLVPPERQQGYGDAFRRLHAMRESARAVDRIAAEALRETTAGLTEGALLPPTDDSETESDVDSR
ncbi:Type I restriction-modification system, DNA methylase subunit [Actinopolyspora mzabensis]|uniref:Type I restriction-modification system, DNA methylase subunit n=1 Tax=Actinopolyspora mzabensis TaxID=995066 RepID=A0A1G8ZN55_ACTMZ|nr:N-6 DNA methylase [Actinopolyspora mzabensis]SDK16443.1 Type I restriction-modification system, DNA methylase subunit [Actinopolyspora mzabensis]